jgi:HK97 family phage major capsid protein
MNLSDLIEKRSTLNLEASAFAKADSITAEARTAFDKTVAEIALVSADIARMQQVVKIDEEQRTVVARPAIVVDEDKSVTEKRAFRNYLLKGETRDLLTTNTGAAVIPQAFYGTLLEAKKSWGGITNLVKTIQTENGAPMKVSLANDTGSLLVPILEAVTVTEQDPTLSSVLLNSEELTTNAITLSIAMLQDSAFDVDGWIKAEFGKRYFRGLASLVTNGSTSGNIQSVTTGYTASNTVTTGTVATVKYADLVALFAAVDPAFTDSSTFTMNSNTRSVLMQIVDTLGRPIFLPAVASGAPDTLFGRPVVLNQFLPNVATGNVAIQFGSYSDGYLLRNVDPGLSVVRLNERYMDKLEIGFLGYARSGGIVTNPGVAPLANLAIK